MALANPGRCDAATNAANNAYATPRGLVYLAAHGIRVTARDPNKGTFSFRATSEKTGREQLFSDIPWGVQSQMWVCCPSSLSSTCNDPTQYLTHPQNPPVVGAVGTLYVDPLWAKHIDLQAHAPKWPAGLGVDPPYEEAVVVPIRLVLECYGTNDNIVSINLRDYHFAEQKQTITCDANGMRVRLSQAGLASLGENLSNNEDIVKLVKTAVDALTSGQPEARLCAQSLAMLATAVEQLRHGRLTGPPYDAVLALVQTIIPGFSPES